MRVKPYFRVTVVALVLTVLSSMNFVSAQETVRNISANISELHIDGAFRVTVVNDNSTTLRFNQTDLDNIRVRVKGNKLSIVQKKSLATVLGFSSKPTLIDLRIGLKDLARLRELKLAGQSKVSLHARDLLFGDLECEVSGASELSFLGKANDLKVELKGASRASVGTQWIRKVSYDISGASSLSHSGDFEEMDLEVSGASEALLSGVGVELDVEASGTCSVDATALNAMLGKVEAEGTSKVRVSIQYPTIKTSGLAHVENIYHID